MVNSHMFLAKTSEGLSFRGLWAASQKAIEMCMNTSEKPPSSSEYSKCIDSMLGLSLALSIAMEGAEGHNIEARLRLSLPKTCES